MSDDKSLRRSDIFRAHVADAALFTGIAPSPAETVVEHRERVAGLELEQRLGIVRWGREEVRGLRHHPLKRLGVVRCDDLVDERAIGEVGPVSVIGRVRRV